MLPWPVFGIIIDFANCWRLSLVCKRFRAYVKKYYRFEYSDASSICSRGTVEILGMFYAQHMYKHYAIEHIGNREIVRFLAERNIIVSRNIYLNAITCGDVEIVKAFMKSSYNIKNIGHYAAYKHYNAEIIKIISKPQQYDLVSALRGACAAGDEERIKELNIGSLIANCYYEICVSGNIELIKKYKYLDDGESGVFGAINSGNIEAVKLFELKEKNIPTAINYAAQAGCYEAVEYLLRLLPGNLAYDDIVGAGICNNRAILELLFSRVKNGSAGEDIWHEIVLHQACDYGNLNTIIFALAKNAKIDDTCMFLAAGGNHVEVVKFLLEKGLKITQNVIDNACKNNAYLVLAYIKKIGDFTCDFCIHCELINTCPLSRKRFKLKHSIFD